MSDQYREIFLRLGKVYVRAYRDGGFNLDMLRNLKSVGSCVLTVYYLLVGSRDLKAIEELDDVTKKQLWELCKPHVKGLNIEQCRDFARCYLALDCLAGKLEAES